MPTFLPRDSFRPTSRATCHLAHLPAVGLSGTLSRSKRSTGDCPGGQIHQGPERHPFHEPCWRSPRPPRFRNGKPRRSERPLQPCRRRANGLVTDGLIRPELCFAHARRLQCRPYPQPSGCVLVPPQIRSESPLTTGRTLRHRRASVQGPAPRLELARGRFPAGTSRFQLALDNLSQNVYTSRAVHGVPRYLLHGSRWSADRRAPGAAASCFVRFCRSPADPVSRRGHPLRAGSTTCPLHDRAGPSTS